MTNTEFIELFKTKVESGEITDIESYIHRTNTSRTKAQKDLKADDWDSVKLGKHFIYIKKDGTR